MIFYTFTSTPLGKFFIYEEREKIIRTSFIPLEEKMATFKNTPLLEKTVHQIQEYFKGRRKNFELPFSLKGTAFQVKVWKALADIPFGEVRSYQELAQSIHHPKAYQAVGNALHRNPIPLLIPCHRIIKKNGYGGGYAYGEEYKLYLLNHEKQYRRT